MAPGGGHIDELFEPRNVFGDLDISVTNMELRGSPFKRATVGVSGRSGASSTNDVHELLGCPVCTNLMYPPIHQIIKGDMNLRNLLVSTKNRSIVVIEDIDCSVEMQNRSTGTRVRPEPKHDVTGITLSGLLNFIDGLWSCCGDERIIVFTTNYKDKLDPALLRPGRMDMRIHMSYLAPSGFRVLALNYLDISTHPLFTQIDDLLAELEVTPATVAEQLMRSDNNPDEALESLLQFLRSKKSEACKNDPQGGGGESDESKSEIQGTIKCDPNGKGGKRRNWISRGKKKHVELWR